MIPDDYGYGPFNEPVRGILRRIKRSMDDVFPRTLEAWENYFRMNRSELGVYVNFMDWIIIAQVYETWRSTAKDPSLSARQTVCKIVFSCLYNGSDEALEEVKLEGMTRTEAERIVELFRCPSEAQRRERDEAEDVIDENFGC